MGADLIGVERERHRTEIEKERERGSKRENRDERNTFVAGLLDFLLKEFLHLEQSPKTGKTNFERQLLI